MRSRRLDLALVSTTLTALAAAAGVGTSTASAQPAPANGALLFGRGGNLYTVLPTGAVLRQLTTSGTVTNAQCSPDGTKIASSDRSSGNDDAWTMKADGSQKVRVTTSALSQTDPSWSRDGSKIAFTGERRVNGVSYYDVYRLNSSAPDGSAIRLTSSRLAGDGSERWDYVAPRWSPVNNTILITEGVNYFDGNVGRAPKLIDGSTGAARANYWSVDALSCDWNPGGSAFVLNADKSGGHQTDYNCIQKAAVSAHTATDVTRCNPAVGNQWSTVWSPDGLLIAYAQGGLGTPQTPGSTYFIKPDGTRNRLFLANALPLDWKRS